MSRVLKMFVTVMVAMSSLVAVQSATMSPAAAASCSTSGPSNDRYQYCTGIRHEVLAAKFTSGTSSWFIQGRTLYVNGRLTDKAADGKCTWMRIRVTNAYWPDGNVYTQPSWKVCGAGNSKVVGIRLDQAWMYPGRVQIQHCSLTGGARIECPTIFSRNV